VKIVGNKEDLGRAIGKGYRGLIGLLDINMARNLIRIYEKNKIGGEARV
jgi:ribosomal protein L7Ae-like RNA K-turn-binding protein